MSADPESELASRVLLVAPTAKDAEVTCAILAQANISCVVCANLYRLSSEIELGAGTVLLTEEAITASGIDALLSTLDRQPPWSELPLVMLIRGPNESTVATGVLRSLRNVTFLERPAPIRSVVSAVQAALRARARQYQIRDQIQAIREAERHSKALQQQLELAVDASELGTFYCAMPLGRIILNYRCKAHLWLPSDAEIDLDFFYSILHPDDRERTRRAVDACVYEGEGYDIEFRTISPQGEVRWVRALGRTYYDANGEPVRFDGTTQDITERKQAEEALRLANRRKDEFLAMLAHELRNPLAPIRNAVQIMRTFGPSNPEIVKETGDMIARQVGHLARLVEDLLDVSRVTQGKVVIKKKPVDLTDVIYGGIELARPFLDAKRHELSVTLPPCGDLRAEGDATRLAQVIGNILNNAAKYTDERGKISLSAVRENDEAVITVSDNGMGVPCELLPHVFDLFTQGERSLDRAQGGLGIGLSLVKSLVELHGGKVVAVSEGSDQGSTFTVRLPILRDTVTPTAAAPEIGGAADSASRRILVVDDNADSAESMGLLLETEGHHVRYAYEGKGALEVADVFEPEVALLDIGLPGMDGFEVARRLRARPETADVVLVALTGYGQAEDLERSKAAGFDYHLIKPVDPQSLLALIAEWTTVTRRASLR